MVQLRNLSIFLLALVNAALASDLNENYLPLMIGVYEFYESSSVIVLSVRTSGDLEQTRVLYRLIRELSRRNIMSITMEISELQTMSYYQNRILPPLFIVLLSNDESIRVFSERTRTFDMSSAYWYVIFLPGHNRTNYCPIPRGNPFNVLFDTEMGVSCPQDRILREWYSMEKNQTIVLELGKWEPDGKLTLLTEHYLHKRRNSLHGLEVAAVIVRDDPFSTLGSNESVSGMCGRILIELIRDANFSISIVKKVASHGRHKERNLWTGAVGELVTNRAECALSCLSISNSRLNAVSFTFPIILSSFSLYIKDPDHFSIEWSNYFRTFSSKVWVAMIILILTTPIILIFMMVVTGERNSIILILDCYFQIWGIICQQGLVEFPQRSSLRFAYISLFISALIFSAAYSAALMSSLANVIHSLPFNSLEEFVKDGTYKLIVLKDSIEHDEFSNSQEPLAKKLMSLMKDEESLPTSLLEGYSQVCNEYKIAMYMSNIAKQFVETEIPCNIAQISIGQIDSISMMWRKKSQFLRLINYYILKLLTNGTIRRLTMKYENKKYSKKAGVNPIPVWSIIPILSFLQIGIVLSVCILIAEKLYFASRRKKPVKSKKKKILNNTPTPRGLRIDPLAGRRFDRVGRIRFGRSNKK